MLRFFALSASAAALTATGAAAQTDIADEIVVTAQKKEQTLQDVPVAVDVIRGDELDAVMANGVNVLALSGRAPSLYAESSFGRTFPRFYMRGFGNTDFDLNANQPVGFYLDGVVQENPALKGFPIFDTERVEVLRGPQGTLFGRNTPAGLVKFESVRPSQEAFGYLQGSYGTFDTVDVQGAYGGPISDTVSFRLSGLYQDRGDVAENLNETNPQQGIGEFEEYAGRAQLLFEPREGFSALLNVHARRQTGGSQIFRANVIAPGGSLVNDFEFDEYDQDARHDSELEQLGGVFTLDVDLGPGTLTSVTGYETFEIDARGDVDGGSGADFLGSASPGPIPFPAESSDAVTDHGQFTQELRYALPIGDALDVTLGAFYFSEDLELDNVSYDSIGTPGEDGNPLNGLAVQDQETETIALFGSATYRASDQLSVIGGLRVSFEDKEFSAERLITPFGGPNIGPLTEDLNDTVVSGDLTVQYDVDADLMVYAKYARGFRAPNVQGRILFGDEVTVADTETIDSFEVGTKSRFADGKGRLGVTGYYFTTDDQQLTAVGGAGNFNQLINADGTKGFGLEVDVAYRPTDWSEFTVGYSLNETEIQDGDLTVAVCGGQPPICTVLDTVGEDGLARIDGNPLPQAPRHIASATYGANAPVGPGELYLFADATYRSEINFFLYESPEFTGRALALVGVEVGYRHQNGVELAGFVRNAFDEVEVIGAVDFNNLTGFVNEPRQYGVRLRAGF